MGAIAHIRPLNWSPRAILKSREVKPSEYEKCLLELLILRADVDDDWDTIDRDIWVTFLVLSSIIQFSKKLRFRCHIHSAV